MAFNINDLRANLDLGGARPTLFTVQLSMPAGVDGSAAASRKLTFSCQSTQLPPSNIGTIPVPYFGRIIKLAGDRNFEPWSVSVLNDEDFLIRNALESWHSLINTRVTNLRDTVTANPNLYKASAIVTQYGKTGNVLREYTFQGLWPAEITPIDLSWGAQDQLEQFNVTFQYDWYDINGPTGTGGQ